MTDPLHLKYRPLEFRDVIGQDAAVRVLEKLVKERGSHAFLLTGPSGVGKTTLARIAAQELGAVGAGIVEMDAATRTGVDDMRELQELAHHRPLDCPVRAIIIDEAHAISRQAWNSLLKLIEEPPAWCYFFFCTTESDKVPNNIRTRCSSVPLQLVGRKELLDLVTWVADEERIKLVSGLSDLIVREARGSPRQALVNLASVEQLDYDAAAEVLQSAADSDTVLELCRFLVSKEQRSWKHAMTIVQKLKTESPEGIRIQVVNYLAVVLEKTDNTRRAVDLLAVLDAFAVSYGERASRAQLLLSIGRALYAD